MIPSLKVLTLCLRRQTGISTPEPVLKQMIKYGTLDIQELQKRMYLRESGAFQEIYERYWDSVFARCNNRLHDPEAAKDLVQDIFMSLWNHPDIRSIRNLEAYILQATKFSILKYIHKAARYQSMDQQLPGILDQALSQDLHEALDSKYLKDLLFQEVERLPERTRVIFKYSREEHLNSKEIAEKLDISPRTVENQISQALKKLRIFLNKL